MVSPFEPRREPGYFRLCWLVNRNFPRFPSLGVSIPNNINREIITPLYNQAGLYWHPSALTPSEKRPLVNKPSYFPVPKIWSDFLSFAFKNSNYNSRCLTADPLKSYKGTPKGKANVFQSSWLSGRKLCEFQGVYTPQKI